LVNQAIQNESGAWRLKPPGFIRLSPTLAPFSASDRAALDCESAG